MVGFGGIEQIFKLVLIKNFLPSGFFKNEMEPLRI